MPAFFADASYWIALVTPDDEFHEQAAEYSVLLSDEQLVTTQLVLNELLNPRSGTSRQRRRAAIALVDAIMQNPRVAIEPQTAAQFHNALARLRNRPDREWSITDCASFLVMERDGIREALTSDRHFEQAGFAVMLK